MGSEMCIRDRAVTADAEGDASRALLGRLEGADEHLIANLPIGKHCLLYTSDAADERSSVDLGGRRIIKQKTHH
mgnify:CR=1 FL=1